MSPATSSFRALGFASACACACAVLCLAGTAPPQGGRRGQEARARDTEQLDLALGLIQRELHDDAAKHLRRFLKRHPDHDRAAEARYRLGTCYLELGDDRRAIRAFEDALERRGFALHAECRYRLGHTLKKKNSNKKNNDHQDLQAAAEQFRRLVREQGREHYLASAALYAEGEALRDLGREKPALERFQAAAACAGKGNNDGKFGLPAIYQAGFLLLRDGQHQDAAATFSLAASRYPKHPARGECLYLAGEAALHGGDTKTATRAYRQAVAAGGEHADKALLGLARCSQADGDREQALRHFRDVSQRFGERPAGHQARVAAGRLLFELKRYREAVAELTPVLAVEELSAELRHNALEVSGLAHLQLGQTQPAIQHLSKALALTKDKPDRDPDRARIAYHLGEAHADKQDWDAAVAYYDRAVAGTAGTDNNALCGDALYGKCLALHRLGRFQESNRAAAELVKRAPEHRLVIDCWFAWAENHFQTKNYKTARETYVKIPADHELHRKARFKAAWCDYLLKKHKRAAQGFMALASGRERDSIREEALSMAALAFYQAKDLDAALGSADRYRARHPKGKHLARSERVAARVLKRQGKLDAAADRLAAAARAEGSAKRAGWDLLEYADLLFGRGDFEGAQQAYRKVSGQPDAAGARAHEGLAWCAFELGDDAACARWIDRGLQHPNAARDGSGRANLLELRSALHHRNRDWEAAEKAAQQFLGEFGDHPRAPHLQYGLGVAQSRNGNTRQARRTLKRLARLQGPGFD
ncbi:MAG: tetratricopeptide repeat protein, partial [Planctomycetota bacterium]